MSSLKTPLITIVCFFLAFFLYTKIAGPIPFFVNSVQTTKTNLFHADGVGKETAVPDIALISFGITKTAPSVSDAQNQANAVMNNLTSELKNLGVPEKNIRTTNYSVYPNIDYSTGKSTPNGYTVSQNVEVRIKPIDRANKAVDLATTAGANNISGITFVLDDQTQKQLEQKARDEAVKNAKDKATQLAKAAGITLGRIVDVQENSTQGGPIPLMRTQAMSKDATEPTSLNPGENTVEISITLSYETY